MISFFKGLKSRDQYMVGNLFFLYLIHGLFVIMIGSILPMMREDYGLNYQIGGYLISAHNVGNTVAGLCAGVLPLLIGLKRSMTALNVVTYIGFAVTLVTGNPALLIIAILMTGLGRGAVANYNNQIVSTLGNGASAPLNALHGFFAIGAVAAPILTLLATNDSAASWRVPVYIIIALGAVSVLTSARMDMKTVERKQDTEEPGSTAPAASGRSMGFLREFPFVYSLLIMFFYLCVEASVMGWMVTYYTDSGVIGEGSTQMMNSLLWVLILIGRFGCTAVGGRASSKAIIRVLSAGIVVFLAVLVLSRSMVPMLIGTIGLGLSLSGMYGTTVSNAGDVFGRYPMAMGIFIFLSGIGSIVTPSIIGAISQVSDIRTGMSVLLVPAVILLVLALLNRCPQAGEGTE